MKTFFRKIKTILKNNSKTLLIFIAAFIVSLPINIGLLLVVGMSTDSGMNEFSVYILKDLLYLISVSLIPAFMLVIFAHLLPLFLMLCFNKSKKIKFNIGLYLILVALQALPYSAILFQLHSNFSLDYRAERINEIKIENGEIVEGTFMYELLSRYLKLNNLDDIRDMVKQDQLVLSYEYSYITNYLDYIDYLSEEDALKKALKIYNQDFPEDRHYITFDRFTFLYLDMIKEFEDPNITVEEVHNKVNSFMGKNMSYNPHDGRTIDDDLEYSLPLIISYENTRILERISKGFSDKQTEQVVLETRLQDALFRVTNFVNGNSYDYQYGEDIQIKDSELYKEYCVLLTALLIDEELTPDKVSEKLNDFNKKHSLDSNNENLKQLQILFQF